MHAEDLGGGLSLRLVEARAHAGASSDPSSPIRPGRAFYIVTLLTPATGTWAEEAPAMSPGSTRGRRSVEVLGEPPGILEARVFPPRPEDGPGGEWWLAADCPGEAGEIGAFRTREEALGTVIRSLRAWDAARRLGLPARRP